MDMSYTESVLTSISSWNTTTSMATSPTSLWRTDGPIAILARFEIVAACFTYGFGFIGNFLSLIVFLSQDEFRQVSTGVLFLLMTISNTIHLWTLTTEFLSTFDVYVYSNIFLQCRLNYFIQNVSRAVSTYIGIGTAVDRFIRSELPARSRIICTRRNALKFTLICLIVFSILCSFWFCPLNTVIPMTNICYTGQSLIYNYFVNNIFFPVRLIVVCIIPVIVMSTANIRMLFNIRQSRHRVQPENQNDPSLTTVNAGLTPGPMTSLDRMLFLMMLVQVTAFIITQIPFHIYTIIRVYHRTLDTSTHLLVRAVLLIWSSVYFGVGAYLYCFASPLFREKSMKIMRRIINCRVYCCA